MEIGLNNFKSIAKMFHSIKLLLIGVFVGVIGIGFGDDLRSLASKGSLNASLQPSNGVRIMTAKSVNLTVSIQIAELDNLNASLVVFFQILDKAVAAFNASDNMSLVIDRQDWTRVSPSRFEYSATVELQGKRVGITSLSVTLDRLPQSLGQTWTIESEYPVRVTKKASPLNRGLRLGTMAAMAVNFMTFGCKLRVGTVKKYLKQPFGIFVGFLFQYGLMPVITYLLGLAAGLKTHFAFALFAVGCAPGGGPSNLCTVILRGDLHMSIIMTFISTVGALGMIPLWMFTLGRVILKTGYPSSEIEMPWDLLGIAVVWFSLPTAIGMLIGRFWPRVATGIVLIVRPIAFLFLLVQVSVFIYFNHQVLSFVDSWRLLAATAATPYIAFALSFIFAVVVFRRTRADAVTIMIETGIQNITFAYFLMVATLPQPDGDIASVVPLLVIFFTYGPIFFIVFPAAAIVNRRNSKKDSQGYQVSSLSEKLKALAEGKVPGARAQLPESESTVSLESVNFVYGLNTFYDCITPDSIIKSNKERAMANEDAAVKRHM